MPESKFTRGKLIDFLSIRIQPVFVFTLVFDQLRIVLAVMRVLFFIDRVTAAAVLSVAMCVVDLSVARFEKTPAQLRQPVSEANVDVKSVEPVLKGLARFRDRQFIRLYFIGRPYEEPEIL